MWYNFTLKFLWSKFYWKIIVFQMPQEYHELPEQVQQSILTCLKVRRQQLTDALLREHYKGKLPTVIDHDWRLKVSH